MSISSVRGASYASRRYALLNRWDQRHERTVSRLLAPRPGERVLEVGCGRGHLTARLAAAGVDIVGVDANPHAEAEAVSQAVRHMRAEALAFADDTFDKVVSIHALEHIPDLDGALADIARVLRPGGRALHVYPAEPVQGLFAIPTAMVLHGSPLAARRVHCHWLWPGKLRRLASAHGFRHLRSEFQLLSTPQFATLLERA